VLAGTECAVEEREPPGLYERQGSGCPEAERSKGVEYRRMITCTDQADPDAQMILVGGTG